MQACDMWYNACLELVVIGRFTLVLKTVEHTGSHADMDLTCKTRLTPQHVVLTQRIDPSLNETGGRIAWQQQLCIAQSIQKLAGTPSLITLMKLSLVW